MNEPMRIQRRRVKGWKMPENTVSVTRPGKWGNPFKVGGHYPFNVANKHPTAALEAIENYKEWADYQINGDTGFVHYKYINHQLGGKNLACWCKLCDKHKDGRPLSEDCPDCDPCHADILLKLANQ